MSDEIDQVTADEPDVLPTEFLRLPGIPVDGRFYTDDDLDFREYHAARKAVRATSGRPDAELMDGNVRADVWPAFTWVIRRRQDPELQFATVLDSLRPKDFPAAVEEAHRNLVGEGEKPDTEVALEPDPELGDLGDDGVEPDPPSPAPRRGGRRRAGA